MITKEDMVELFADMTQNAPWDLAKPLLWGYFFADPVKSKLEVASEQLKAKGYQIVGIYDSKPEASVPALWWLHVEKAEAHGRHTARPQPGVLRLRRRTPARILRRHG